MSKETGIQEAAPIPRKPVPSQYVPPKRRYGWDVRARWNALTFRTRIIILLVLVAILALVIGLAAGLATRHHGAQNLPLPTAHGGPYEGDLTYYAPGLGACGVTSTNSDRIVAVSHFLFDAVRTGSDPNTNPLCGKKIRARRDNKSVDLTVVDRCTGCKPTDLDVTVDSFTLLANVDLGRVKMEWSWLEDVPTNAQG